MEEMSATAMACNTFVKGSIFTSIFKNFNFTYFAYGMAAEECVKSFISEASVTYRANHYTQEKST